MATYLVGFDGEWQERFRDRDEAIEWGREVAATGRTVEVVVRRFGFCSFLTAFPESERAALQSRWRRPIGLFADAGGGIGADHHYGHAHGGHGGGDGGGHGGHGGHGG